jgi:dipeptidyl aminopeptidase/acylaminoacyl peptidase
MVMLSAMRPRDPRYASLPLAGHPDLDASLAYVMMGWPVLDPHARYLHARERGRADLLESHHRYFGDEATMREANPQQILERGERVELPPALIFQGADDDVLSPRTAERFVEAYGQAGGIIELAKFPHAGHGYSREGGPNSFRTIDLLNCFVDRQLKAMANHWFA